MTIDGSEAHEAAIKSDNAEHGTTLIIRQVQYLHNVAEQDHRGVKRVTRPMLGCTSLEAAQGTLAGLARMPMIKKQHMRVGTEDAGRTAAEQFDALASSSPHRQDRVASNRPHTLATKPADARCCRRWHAGDTRTRVCHDDDAAASFPLAMQAFSAACR